MKKYCFAAILSMLFAACAGMPELIPVRPSEIPEIIDRCNTPFSTGKRQFVHSIEATMPGGKKAVMMGISDISPESGTVHCIMMTIEGLVLFDAVHDRKITVNRAVPPFDSYNFAEGLMDDIKLLFFRPDTRHSETGILENGTRVCRHTSEPGVTIDVICHEDNTWTIRKYLKQKPVRTIRASKMHDKIPGKLELEAHGLAGYSLVLKLVQTDP